MTFLHKLLGANMAVNDERAWTSYAGGPSASGEAVSYSTALKVSAYYACVRLISDTVGILPKHVMERHGDDTRTRATSHPLYDLVHLQPNRAQTSIEFFSMMTAHAVMRNNAYAKIVPGARGFVDQIVPLHPDLVRIENLPDGGYRYMVRESPGKMETPYNDEDILHLRGFQQEISKGLDMLPLIREHVGVSLATLKYRARFFGNNASPGGVLKKQGKLSDQAKVNLKTSWEAAHSGAGQHRVAVLEDGLEWQSIGIDPRAAQLIESEEFNAEDVCRWLGVPPFMIGLTSKSTSWGTGIEQQNIGFVTYTIMPLTVRWQQAIARDLILAPDKYYVEFVLDGLLRGDSQQRYNVYRIGRELGTLSANEIRKLENMNPRTDPEGDTYVSDMGRSMAPTATVDNESALAGHNEIRARYIDLLRESAGRVVRKEIAALSKAAKKFSSSDLDIEIKNFYADHAAYVSQSLRVPEATGAAWVDAQLMTIAADGLEAVYDEAGRVAALVELVTQ